MSPNKYQLFYQRKLPHFQPEGATLFITFRLHGSLPSSVIQLLDEQVRIMNEELIRQATSSNYGDRMILAQEHLFEKWDGELDIARFGPHWLAESEIAEMVCEALRFWDGVYYTLEAFCVMPNHVHWVITPLHKDGQVFSLSKIMHSIKRYTANQANKLLSLHGEFWQHESYDHVVRNTLEYRRIVNYVLENPARAGLEAKWIYSRLMDLSM